MLFHKNDTGNMLTVYYVRAYLMLCDDKFFSPQNWKTDSSWTEQQQLGEITLETTWQRERKLVTISWYTEIYFERAYTDVKDKTILVPQYFYSRSGQQAT